MEDRKLVWEDDGDNFNRLQKQLKEQADQERTEILDNQRKMKRNRLKLRLLNVPFLGVYALIITRMIFDGLDSWSLRETHQTITAITEPFLSLFQVFEPVDIGIGAPVNPSHLLAIAGIIAIHFGVMVLARLMTPTR